MAIACVTEINAASRTSFDDAVEQGITRAVKTLSNVQDALVQDRRLIAAANRPPEYRVALKITYVLDD